ncbi:MAG TPA: phospho-N-acetylmuramoyl-pentapeptide-transferase [Prolixibacteraceae bacterium]|nr:phospho-N-acetylmuramoyl-pentapeptide-transferase [Prolixibacteraceae bacterium]HPR60575.1 phospho-N-acetylmuramoyl-pentapeptide-transferase [Prolixibacteraceae bacterium]
MLYHLFELIKHWDIPGLGIMQYITFRAAAAVILSLVITMVFGKRIIRFLQRKQIGEEVRDLGLEGQLQKKGTPTMGGLIIIASILIPTLLFARLDNTYIWLMIITTIWLGLIGFIDDYIKVFLKDKKGLAGKFKILGQISLGLIVVGTLYFSDDVLVREKIKDENGKFITQVEVNESTGQQQISYLTQDVKSSKTTIPFVKNQELDYRVLVSFLPKNWHDTAVWILYALIVIFIITAVSNATNLTDGLDGLAAGTTAISGATLGALAYVSGHIMLADYLNIMYIPNIGELSVFVAAFIGATVGFLWYNAFPAQVFMGDTGSLALGGILAVFAIIIRKEIMIPIFCGIFVVENLSVVLQVSWFKYTKRRFGEGRRIFLMSPLHHHYQKKGYHESKIVARFWIVAIMLAIISIITLKVR